MVNQPGGYVVGIDLGTSNTVAVIRSPDGRRRPVLFDGAPLMPSAVFLQDNGQLAVGRDAQRLAQLDPGRYEPNPKRRIDEPSVLLGDLEVPTRQLLAAVLQAAAAGVSEITRTPPPLVLTYPASWGQTRRTLLQEAALAAGWPQVSLVPEPVAAARYFISALNHPLPRGSAMVVYDFGGGTIDIAVVRNDEQGFTVVGSGGLEDVGGLDIDAALVEHIGEILRRTAPDVWQRLQQPVTAQDRRDRRFFWEDIRGAKEMLSRGTVAPVQIPGVEAALHLTREELERLITPMLRRTVAETAAVVSRCRLAPDKLAGIMLVGGSSRVPLVARMLHRELGVVPTVLEQPELPVAEGAVVHPAELSNDGRYGVATGSATVGGGPFTPPGTYASGPGVYGSPASMSQAEISPATAAPIPAAPVSGLPSSGPPVSGAPVAAFSVSAPPASAPPAPAPPVSAPPVSAPPVAGSPVSGPPHAGPPVLGSGARNVAPSSSGRKLGKLGTLVAAALIVLLLVVGGVAWRLGAFDGTPLGAPEKLGSWTSLQDVPVQVDGQAVGFEGAAAAVTGGKLYVIGGLADDQARTRLDTVWVLDTSNPGGGWQEGPKLPAPVSHAAAVVTNTGKLFVLGGWVAEGGTSTVLRLSDDGSAWEDAAPLPEPRVSGAAAFDGDTIVFGGGTDSDQHASDQVWAMAADGSDWVHAGNLRTKRTKLAAISDGTGNVWFVGGRDPDVKDNGTYADIDLISHLQPIGSDAKLDEPREGASAVFVKGIGLCVLGGNNGNTVYQWYCQKNGADRLPELSPGRSGMAVAVAGRSIYAVGGYNDDEGFHGTRKAQVFTPKDAG